jgi:hypothetical protein
MTWLEEFIYFLTECRGLGCAAHYGLRAAVFSPHCLLIDSVLKCNSSMEA